MQKRTARFVTRNYNYETGSMTGILGQLKWESLTKMRKGNRLILLYKSLKYKSSYSLLPTDDLILLARSGRNHRSVAFRTYTAGTDIYKSSFFQQNIKESVFFSAEIADDCVAKANSLMKGRE